MINPETFCVLAYNGLCINHDGTLDPCCQYLPDQPQSIKFTDYKTYVSKIRQEMHDDHIAGRKHSGCKKCWQEEELGLKSLRFYANEIWYKNLATPVVSEDNPILEIELRFGNLCNLKCMMCDPKASSALHTERLVNASVFEQSNVQGIRVVREKVPEWWETKEFEQFSPTLFNNTRRVNITGGEPFMIAKTIGVLDQMLSKSSNLMLGFNSNLTKLPQAILERLVKFSKLRISVSLEGIGDMAEYLRYPCTWAAVDKNIRTLIESIGVDKISVHHTLQHGSIYSLPALAEYCYLLNIPVSYTTVQGIECLKLSSVPPDDCKKFLQWVKTTQHLNTANKNFLINAVTTTVFDREQYKDFKRYVATLDQVRGTSWNTVFHPSHA